MQTKQALSGAALSASTLGADTAQVSHASGRQGDLTPGRRGGLETAGAYISDNPWYAAAIAVGAGILLGLLLPRK